MEQGSQTLAAKQGTLRGQECVLGPGHVHPCRNLCPFKGLPGPSLLSQVTETIAKCHQIDNNGLEKFTNQKAVVMRDTPMHTPRQKHRHNQGGHDQTEISCHVPTCSLGCNLFVPVEGHTDFTTVSKGISSKSVQTIHTTSALIRQPSFA